MDVKKCTVCNIEIDEDNCKKDRNICKICYNINRKKNNNNEKKRKSDNSVNKRKIDNVTIRTTILFQNLKIIDTLLSALVTLAKPITCSKYLKE